MFLARKHCSSSTVIGYGDPDYHWIWKNLCEINKEYSFLSYFGLNETLYRPLLLNCLSLSVAIFK